MKGKDHLEDLGIDGTMDHTHLYYNFLYHYLHSLVRHSQGSCAAYIVQHCSHLLDLSCCAAKQFNVARANEFTVLAKSFACILLLIKKNECITCRPAIRLFYKQYPFFTIHHLTGILTCLKKVQLKQMKLRENISYLTMACAFMFLKVGYIIGRINLISSTFEPSSIRVPNSVGFCHPPLTLK